MENTEKKLPEITEEQYKKRIQDLTTKRQILEIFVSLAMDCEYLLLEVERDYKLKFPTTEVKETKIAN